MNNRKIILNKLFPLPPNESFHKLMIDDESVSYITTPINSDMIVAIIDFHIPDHIQRFDLTVLDGTACVGGDSITFGKTFGTVISSEIDLGRYRMLKNNLLEYELYNVVPVNSDCLKILERINFIDIAYFDPPWGGRQYKYKTDLRLSIGDFYIDELVNYVFNSTSKNIHNINTCKSDIQMIVLKLPKNYDLKTLHDNTKHLNITMYLYELLKMHVVVIKKNNAWKHFN